MKLLGVLGGMGPAATVDFMGKLVALTPAACDQEHLPVMVASLPHIPDRSRCILGDGPDPLPYLLAGIDHLNHAGVSLVVVPCNTSHHWFDQMQQRSVAPMIHIATACVAALPTGGVGGVGKVSIFATRGAIRSGFYQRELASRGMAHTFPDPEGAQNDVDECIRAIKGGDMARGSAALARALADAQARRVGAVIMGCTEIPVAARGLKTPLALIDSSLELARQATQHALSRGWNRPPWATGPLAMPAAGALAAAAT
jgi:aspartate racemase